MRKPSKKTPTAAAKERLVVSTLRPGLLVSVKTSVRGNCSYDKTDVESKRLKSGADVVRWETERTINDPVEFEAAHKARGLARTAINRVCSHSAFGLLCPEDRENEFVDACAEAHRIVEGFNAKAKLSRLSFNILSGRIAQDDVEAVRAINAEVRELIEDMQEGLKNLDVKAVRKAASATRNLGQMLTKDSQERIAFAITAARGAANEIRKAGSQAAVEIDKRTIAALAEARTAFLDIEAGAEIVAPRASARTVDFEDEAPAPIRQRKPQPQLDLE